MSDESIKAAFVIDGTLQGRVAGALITAISLARARGLDDTADRYEQTLADFEAVRPTIIREVKL